MDKVLFGFRNVVYSVITETPSGISYGTPKVFADEGAGGVSVALSPVGDKFSKYADDIPWFVKFNNQGYEGDLVMTKLTDDFKKDVMGMTEDENGALIENADAAFKNFALGFEVQGNENPKRTWYYYCSVARPNDEANTKEESMSTNDATLSITALPRPTDRKVKVSMTKSTDNAAAFNSFFSQVYEEETE